MSAQRSAPAGLAAAHHPRPGLHAAARRARARSRPSPPRPATPATSGRCRTGCTRPRSTTSARTCTGGSRRPAPPARRPTRSRQRAHRHVLPERHRRQLHPADDRRPGHRHSRQRGHPRVGERLHQHDQHDRHHRAEHRSPRSSGSRRRPATPAAASSSASRPRAPASLSPARAAPTTGTSTWTATASIWFGVYNGGDFVISSADRAQRRRLAHGRRDARPGRACTCTSTACRSPRTRRHGR